MTQILPTEYRCACGRLLCKGRLQFSFVEIKCKRCGSLTVFGVVHSSDPVVYRETETPHLVSDEKMDKEPATLLCEVGECIQLSDEVPRTATVSDAQKLRDTQFFAHAEDGDKVLVFRKTMQAILYRPGTKRIIAVAPAMLREQESSSESVFRE